MKPTILTAFCLLTAGLAHGAIVLDFGGLANGESVGNYYGGGAGPNYGITFSNALA